MLFDNQNHLQDGDHYTRCFQSEAKPGNLILNMGPQHPSTHGVLRIIVEIDGEYIRRAEPVLGYIHRMQEKMGEVKTWQQYLPNMGRVDYLHALAWNWAYVGAVERLIGLEPPRRAEFIRVITCELNRINSHLLWWGAYLLDLGAFTPIMYAFVDREEIMDILQMVTGSRLTYCFYRFGGVSADISPDFIDKVKTFCAHFKARLPMFRDLVTDNMILRQRTEDIGHISLDTAQRYGATGPIVRGSGQAYDIRRTEPYSVYDCFDFDIPVFHETDAFARYMVRMLEMEQSICIIEQALEQLPDGPIMHPKAPLHLAPAAGEAYFAVESGRGKVGVYVVSDGGPKPYKVKLRAPCFSNLHLFAEISQGVLLSDAVSILGSLDLVIPEIDR
jgi:NADH-quinone oxidoreductase subunit D